MVEATGKMFPITHNLNDLALKAKLVLTKEQKKDLLIINTFNIAGRYDDYKSSFYKTATQTYAKKYYQITKKLYLWLKNQSA